MAERLFRKALPSVTGFTSPRAWAFTLIGIHESLRYGPIEVLASSVRATLTGRLTAIFDQVSGPGWDWFENSLTYDNAKLAHALIVTGRAAGHAGVDERGLQALRWLVDVQTSRDGHFRPIGSNGFYPRNRLLRHSRRVPKQLQQPLPARRHTRSGVCELHPGSVTTGCPPGGLLIVSTKVTVFRLRLCLHGRPYGAASHIGRAVGLAIMIITSLSIRPDDSPDRGGY